MSEEEIIDRLNKILEQWQKIVNIEDDIERDIEMNVYIEEMPFYEIKGLLDLYQKEKEKNKELEKDKKAFVNQYGNMLLKISELEKENREIRDWKYVIDSYEDLDKLKELDLIKIKGKEYISKDKIKEIIKDLSCPVENTKRFIRDDQLKTFFIKIQELLNESEE